MKYSAAALFHVALLSLRLWPGHGQVSPLDPYEALHKTMPKAIAKYTRQNGQQDTVVISPTQDDGHLVMARSLRPLGEDSFEIAFAFTAHNESLEFQHLELFLDMDLAHTIMMADGFQSWSQSRELDNFSFLSPISPLISTITHFDLQGDYNFFKYSGRQGDIHSTCYTYFRNTDNNKLVFLGSLSEDTGYTYFKAALNDNQFSIYKDIEGKHLSRGETLTIKIFVTRSNNRDMNTIWQQYAGLLIPEPKSEKQMTGWTSWYNYYEKVTEKDVLTSLSGFVQHGYPIDVFQVDDGFQMKIGDWLELRHDKFPSGMPFLTRQITQAGFIPGLWLAPYAVGFESRIVREHPDWLLHDKDGSLVVAGPNWGGFYALDMYHPDVRQYLQKVLDTVIDEWGFRFLKLDFIFATAMRPRLGKTRGQIMVESVALLDEMVGKRALLLGSGVTLAATWGHMEYCRISSDAAPYWDHFILRLGNVRERVATANALQSVLSRWPMRALVGTDPDVSFIRSRNNMLSVEERYTTVVANNILGQLTLMSDNVQLYEPEEHRLYATTFPKIEAQIGSVMDIGSQVFEIRFQYQSRQYITFVNLSPMPQKVRLSPHDAPYGYYFEHQNSLRGGTAQWHKVDTDIHLKAHETRTFLAISDRFGGSTGHIVPGAEIADWQQDARTVHITVSKKRKHIPFEIYVLMDGEEESIEEIYVDNTLVNPTPFISTTGVQMVMMTL